MADRRVYSAVCRISYPLKEERIPWNSIGILASEDSISLSPIAVIILVVNVRIGTYQSEIVDLVGKKNLDAVLDHLVDILLVGGATPSEGNEDGRNMCLPEASRFRVSLHGTEDR